MNESQNRENRNRESRGYAGKETDGEKGQKSEDFKKELFGYIRMIVVVVLVIVLLQEFIIINARIPSASMEPTVSVGNQIFGSRLTYKFRDPERYDIIIFHDPDNPKKLLIKRIIGMPGDIVDVHDGNVYINGSETPLEDRFCMEPSSTLEGNLVYPIVVPSDSYFVLGDNRMDSNDSRFWTNTFVQKGEILGNAVFRYWPVWEIGPIHGAEEGWYNPQGA